MSNQEKPECECHGVPMAWQPEPSMRAGGRWRCRVQKREWDRENQRARRARDPERARDEERRRYAATPERHREVARNSYHRGGWITKRKRELARQRGVILEQLEQLAEEAASC